MRRVASGELAHVRSTQGSSNNGKIPQATATLPHYLTDVQTGSVEREAPGRDEDARREGAYHATECDDHRHGCGSVHRVRRYGRLRPRRWGRRPRWQSEWRFRSGSSGSRIQRHPRAGWCSGRIADQTVAPQFNDPGPQLALPRPGNSVQQLSPLGSAGQPDSLGIK
jgi:hypothetical protein